LTTFYVNYEEEKHTLTIEINIPKVIYNSSEYFHLPVYQESFHTEDDIYTKYYKMNVDTIWGYIEKKVKEHLVSNNHTCDVLSCESPYNLPEFECNFIFR